MSEQNDNINVNELTVSQKQLNKINKLSVEEWQSEYIDKCPKDELDVTKFFTPDEAKLHIYRCVEKNKVNSYKKKQLNLNIYNNNKHVALADEGNMPLYTEEGDQWDKRFVARTTARELYGEDENGNYALKKPENIDEDVLEEVGTSINSNSPLEQFKAGVKYFNQIGIDVRVTGDTLFSNLSFYKLTRPKELKGLSLPEDFKQWQPILKHSEDLNRLSEIFQLMPKNIYKFWQSAISGLGSDKSALGNITYLFQDLKNHKVSITGLSDQHKFIPALNAFPEQLRAIEPEDLITILPKAEANTLLHVLGRVACQESERWLAEGKFSTSNRCAILLAGQPTCGKSALLEYIVEALKYGGYESGLIPLSLNQFGWEQVVNKDMAYLDDLNSNSVMSLFNNTQLKPIISNGMVPTEAKGQNKVDARSKTVLFAITNEVRIPKNADTGNMNRWHILQCHSLTKLQGEQDLRTWQYWERLSMELKIDPLLIPLYIIRKGINEHLDANGVTLNEDNELVQDRLAIKATERLEENRKQYLYQYPVNMQQKLLSGHSKVVTLQCALDKNYDKLHDDKGSFTAGSLHLYFKTTATIAAMHKELTGLVGSVDDDMQEVYQETIKACDMLLEWFMPQGLFSKDNVITQFNAIEKATQTENVGSDTTWEKVIKCVSSQIGVRPTEKREYYHDGFKVELENRVRYRQELDNILKQIPVYIRAEIAKKVMTIQKKL